MSRSDSSFSQTRIPLVSGAVIAVRRRPWLAYVLLVIAFAAIGWLWMLQQTQQQAAQRQQQKLDTLSNRLTEMQQQQQQLLNDFTQRSRQLDVVEARLTRWDDMLNAGQRHIWLMNEATYYLRLAQQHLTLTRDTQGTKALLASVDQLLAQQTDSRLLPLRQALAHDQLALAAANSDTTGLYLRLSALADRIHHLQDIRRQASPAPITPNTPHPALADTASVWEKGWDKLQQLVTIRRHAHPLQPLLSETEQALVKEALRLDLAQAQLALLQANDAIYEASLTAAEKRLQQFFPLLSATEQAALQQEFTALRTSNIRAELPNLDSSLQALEALTSTQPISRAATPATTGKAP